MPVFRPGKPYVLGSLSADVGMLLGDLDIPFDVIESDGDISLDANGGRATIDVAGLYLATLSALKSAGPSGTFGVLIVVNGVLVAGSMPVSTGNLPVPRSTAWMGQLDVGDVIAWQKRSSANVTVDTEGTSVGLARIGPVRWV